MMLLPQNPGPSTTESELSHRNPSRSTSGIGCSYLCNRVVPPLMVLLPLHPFYPTSEGAPAAESGPFNHRIRTATQEPELFHIRNPICSTTEPELFHLRNPICPTTESELFLIRNRAIPPLNPARNLKSRGEFTASRQI